MVSLHITALFELIFISSLEGVSTTELLLCNICLTPIDIQLTSLLYSYKNKLLFDSNLRKILIISKFSVGNNISVVVLSSIRYK